MRYQTASNKLKSFSAMYLATEGHANTLKNEAVEMIRVVLATQDVRVAELSRQLGINRSYLGRVLNSEQAISSSCLAALGTLMRQWDQES